MIGLMAWAAAVAANAGPLERCDPPAGWDAVAARGTRFVVFGEVHGTEQAPALVGDVACALAFRGERLLIAVEERSRDNAALQRAWALPEDRFAAALRRFGWWHDDGDGRGSAAMYALLMRLHRLSVGGRTVDVVAFNDERGQDARFSKLPGQGAGEAAKADNIRTADAGRYDHVLVLTGGAHAAKRSVTRGATVFQPMAMRLGPASAITSLALRNGAGNAWDCRARRGVTIVPGKPVPAAAIDCGPHPLAASASLAGAPAMGLGTAPGAKPDPSYDGWFWIGAVTASPPYVAGTGGR